MIVRCFRVEVRTGAYPDSETDCEVYIQLKGTGGLTDRTLLFNAMGDNSFDRASLRYFDVRVAQDLQELEELSLWIGASGNKDSWFLEDVVVWHARRGTAYEFPCGRVVKHQGITPVVLRGIRMRDEYCEYVVALEYGVREGCVKPSTVRMRLHGASGEKDGGHEVEIELDDQVALPRGFDALKRFRVRSR